MYPNNKGKERNKSVNVAGNIRSKKDEEEERKKLVEKLAITLKMKYSKLFRETNYEIRDLCVDLNDIVKVNDLPFEAYIIQIEKVILAKVSKRPRTDNNEQAKNVLVTDMKKINNLIKEPISQKEKENKPAPSNSKRGKVLKKNGKSVSNLRPKINHTIDSDSHGNINSGNKQLSYLNTLEEKAYQSEKPSAKLEEIKIKREDEWAKLANHNYNKYQEELYKLKQKEEEKKKQMRENLAKQILEKQNYFMKEKELDQNFQKQHHDILNKQDAMEQRKKDELLNKIRKEKEIRDYIVVEAKEVKKKVEEKQEKEDQRFLDKIKKDMMTEDEKHQKKKEEERDMYKKLIRENEERLKLRKNEKEREKQENIKALDDYSKFIEKQEQDRINQKQARLDRISNFMEKFGNSVKVDEHMIKVREEKRFLKEIEEKERRDMEKEKEEKEKRRFLNKEVKNVLDKQINERKAIDNQIKVKDKQFDNEITTQINRYEMERMQKVNQEKERTKKYKEELTIQVKDKSRYKVPSMDEKERLINRIDEIITHK